MAAPSLRGRLARVGNPRRPVLKPSKPLVLGNRVGEQRRQLGEATCITEMSLMMACWKQNEFNDTACAREIQVFHDCAAKAEMERKLNAKQDSQGSSGNLSPKQVNKLLQRFPNISFVA
ncbi:coiled-coil-helix-coiled-coil-helix domain-containing protein 1 [Tachyglossus aculeatus]|uniref:coiled-coil-helix-coiled-coil-helix domain-containing protein 1 n=1 Tax=Tachyglossus aculeatus TaxID=9261 RepID=UPI0018F4A22F|nr:coiled-coil-helix-coiled-coil-helix domain-containing protein 1 [Tachyglossus aculeatus]